MKPNAPAPPKTTAETAKLQSFFRNPGSQVPRDDSSMDWSEDIPEVQSMPTPRVSPAERNMPSPHAPLPNRNAKGKKRANLVDFSPSVLNYGRNQLAILSFWEGAHHALSIFGTDPTAEIDAKNMAQSITQIIDYIRNNPADKKAPAREFEHVVNGLDKAPKALCYMFELSCRHFLVCRVVFDVIDYSCYQLSHVLGVYLGC